MKTIITGPKYINSYRILHEAILNINWTITEIISGCNKGVDQLGEKYGLLYNIAIKKFPINSDKYGKRAEYMRNSIMIEYADALLAIYDQKSKRTKLIIKEAEEKNLMMIIFNIEQGVVC